jgi:hypothetical protein
MKSRIFPLTVISLFTLISFVALQTLRSTQAAFVSTSQNPAQDRAGERSLNRVPLQDLLTRGLHRHRPTLQKLQIASGSGPRNYGRIFPIKELGMDCRITHRATQHSDRKSFSGTRDITGEKNRDHI